MCADVFSVFVFVALIQESEGISWIYWPLVNGVVLTNLNLKQKKIKLILIKGALSWRFCCMLDKTIQIFDKEPLLKREIALREIALAAVRGKYKMISPKKNKLESGFSNFPKIHRRNLTKWTNFFKLQSISILVIRRQK